jgi:hypothetical protein
MLKSVSIAVIRRVFSGQHDHIIHDAAIHAHGLTTRNPQSPGCAPALLQTIAAGAHPVMIQRAA